MLKGIRVIDFSVYLPGPYATMRLADLGAEVIKIEPPAGDPARTTDHLLYLANNRSKKSICLNLKETEGRHTALDLICQADIVIESFRPGVMEKLGLGYEAIKIRKPDIIYCSLSGFGQQSLLSALGSHDLNYMALSGVLAQLKDENGKPVHPTTTFADLIGGIAANEAILAAICHREKTGEGQYIDISLTDVMVSLMANHVLIEKETGFQQGVELLAGTIVNYAVYETSDHRFVSLAALEKKFWENFCLGVKKEVWISAFLSKTQTTNPVFQEVQNLFKSKTLQEWTKFGLEVDCCLTPVLEVGELFEQAYIKEKGLISDQHGIRQVKTQPLSQLTQAAKPPELDEHRDEILTTVLNIQ